jgi:hypothetical protein
MPLACGNQGAVVKYLREWLGDKAGEMPDCSPYSGEFCMCVHAPSTAAPTHTVLFPAIGVRQHNSRHGCVLPRQRITSCSDQSASSSAHIVAAGGFPAGTGSAGGGGSGGAQRRKAFSSSLCSNRAAILNAAGASPVHYHSGGAGRGKGRKGGGNQTALAAYSTGPGAKQK